MRPDIIKKNNDNKTIDGTPCSIIRNLTNKKITGIKPVILLIDGKDVLHCYNGVPLQFISVGSL
jgi:hypothetical protein